MAESIYNFVEQPKKEELKKEIYRSKFDPKGPLIGSTFCMHGTTAVDGKGFHSLKKVGVSVGSLIPSPLLAHHKRPLFYQRTRTTS